MVGDADLCCESRRICPPGTRFEYVLVRSASASLPPMFPGEQIHHNSWHQDITADQ